MPWTTESLIAAAVFAAAAVIVVLIAARTRRGVSIRGLRGLEDDAFYARLGTAFTRRGYHVTHRDDGGTVQLALERNGQIYLVCARHWRAEFVGATPIGELSRRIAAEEAAGGYAITTGRFTQDARKMAQRGDIEILDGRELGRFLTG